jgi:hypothetical protein
LQYTVACFFFVNCVKFRLASATKKTASSNFVPQQQESLNFPHADYYQRRPKPGQSKYTVVDPAEMAAMRATEAGKVVYRDDDDDVKKKDYYDDDEADEEFYDEDEEEEGENDEDDELEEGEEDGEFEEGEEGDEDGEYSDEDGDEEKDQDDEDERLRTWDSFTEEEKEAHFEKFYESQNGFDWLSLPQEEQNALIRKHWYDTQKGQSYGIAQRWHTLSEEEKQEQFHKYLNSEEGQSDDDEEEGFRAGDNVDHYTEEGKALIDEEGGALGDSERDLAEITDQERLLLFDNEWFLQKMRRGIFERKNTKKKRDFLDELMENAWFESPKTSSGSYEVYFRNPAAKSLKFPKPRPLEQLLHAVEPRLTGIDRNSPGYKKGVQVWNILLKNPYYTWKQKEEMSENAAKEWNDYHSHIKQSEAEGYQADEIFQRDFRRGRPYRARKEQEALDARMLANQKVRAHRSTETDWEVEAVEDEDELFNNK